ncbi:MAG: alpha/beta hydrolase [Bacteroidia bacterium]|nr:alpha/beta hydrolase [Bacteroidia bacterium]
MAITSENLLTISGWPVSFTKYGSGKELLFAFHGYGQSAQVFKSFKEIIGNKYTIVSFDLLFHGELAGKTIPSAYLTRNNLKEQIQYFLDAHSCKTFSVIGYSLGGKLAMNCLEIFPENIHKLVLMAPDGIKVNPFYKFVTRTSLGKSIYQFTINSPGIVFFINRLSHALGFINQKVFRFVNDSLESKDKRQKVFDAWLVYSRMLPDIDKIAPLINQHKINVKLFFGQYDSIIHPKKGKKLINKLENKSVVEVLDTGHNLFTEREKIAQYLLQG